MKKLFSLLIVALMATTSLFADDISAEQALQIANKFATSPSTQKLSKHRAPVAEVTPMLAHTLKSKVATEKDNVYVINLGNDQGFVIVSGESGTSAEVLGYCDHGSFSYDKAPIQMKGLLDSYNTSIDQIRQNPMPTVRRRAPQQWPSYIGSIVVEPLIKTTWDQDGVFNALCPEGCPAGCYPVALAQVMNYWKWPKESSGKQYNPHTADFSGEEFAGHTYDWDNMLDDYQHGYTAQQANAVATLIADIGKAFGTKYEPGGSPTSFDYHALVRPFHYSPNIKVINAPYLLQLQEQLKTELDARRPVLFCGYGIPDYHALVCDGYTDADYFHFNYGWGGYCDGFYKGAVSSGTPTYFLECTIFTGVEPTDSKYVTIDNIEYCLQSSGEAHIVQYLLEGVDGVEIVIPDEITYEGRSYQVTALLKRAFFRKGHFSKMVIGNHVETIDPSTFLYSTIDELVLSDKMKVVPDEAFQLTEIQTLTIGASVERVGRKAFYLCPLRTVVCKSPAFEAGDYAFAHAYGSIDSGDWLNHITKIGEQTFTCCTFTNVPGFAMLEEVGSRAFASCTFPEEEFVVPSKLKSIEPDAFWGAPLSFFKVENNPNFLCSPSIQEYLCNSNGTSMLMSVNRRRFGLAIPETVVKLEPRSIRAKDLTTIPGHIIEMEGAYQDMTSLSYVSCEAVVPPKISDTTFNDKIFEKDPVLYVPVGTEPLYRNAPGWRRFSRIYDELEYKPMAAQGREYYMVVNSTDEEKVRRVSIPLSEVTNMVVSDDGKNLIIHRNGKADVMTLVVALDSISWAPGFVYENAEIFNLNDSTLTVEAQKCKVTFDPTCIDEDVQLCVRNSVLKPNVMDGVESGFAVDLSLSNGEHELTGTALISIPMTKHPDRELGAAYYNEETGEWQPVYFEYDEAAGTVNIMTDHLSTYGFFEFLDEMTTGAMLRPYKEIATSEPLNEAAQKLLEIVASDDPEWEMKWNAKNDMGLWQSIGLDVIFNAANGTLEAVKGYKPFAEEVENAVNAMGYLATALNVLDVARADLKGDDVGVAAGTLKTILGHYTGVAGQFIGTTAFSVSMAGVAVIGIALEKFGTMIQERVVDLYRKAYDFYYEEKGHHRSATDWYNLLYPAFSNPDKSNVQIESYLEAVVHKYCDEFWTMPYENRAFYVDKAKATGLSSFFEPSQAAQKQISDEYYEELMNGILVSVVHSIKNHLAIEAYNRYAKYAEDMASLVNTRIGLRIVDNSCKKDEKSKYAGWTIKFSYIPSTLKDSKTLETTLDEMGCSTIGPFTKYALIVHDIPTRLTLIDSNGKDVADYPFTLTTKKGKQIITIDLSTGGEEVENPHLTGLELKYDPDRPILATYFTGFDYTTDWDDNVVKYESNMSASIPIPLDNSFNKNANFQEKIEKYLNHHDYITVDEYGNVKLGDDILTKFEGNEAKAKFNINTIHKFYERSVEEYVRKVNTFNDKDGDASNFFNLLDGEITHKISGEVIITRSEDGESYDVTYTGEGTFDFNGRYVSQVDNFNIYAFTHEGENQKLTVDDVSTDNTQVEGTVMLKYSTRLK